jgi:hypothetical protein
MISEFALITLTAMNINKADSVITKENWVDHSELVEFAKSANNEGYFALIMAMYGTDEMAIHPTKAEWSEWLHSGDTFFRLAGYTYLIENEKREFLTELEYREVIRLDTLELNNWARSELAYLILDLSPKESADIFNSILQRNPDFSMAWEGLAYTAPDEITRLYWFKKHTHLYQEEEDVIRLIRYLYYIDSDIDEIEKLLLMLPTDSEYLLLAECYRLFIQSDYELCVQAAINYNPEDSTSTLVQSILGWSLFHLGKLQIAKVCFEGLYDNFEVILASRDLYTFYFLTNDLKGMERLVSDVEGNSHYYDQLHEFLVKITNEEISKETMEFYKSNILICKDPNYMLPFLLKMI